MTDSKRDGRLRVNDADLRMLKSARDEIDPSLALGYVARLGAKRLLEEDEDDSGVTF